MIDLPTQQAHNAFQLEEVKDELVCGIELAVHRDARAVIVPMESLTPMAGISNEMGGGEDQIVSGDRNTKLTALRQVLRRDRTICRYRISSGRPRA